MLHDDDVEVREIRDETCEVASNTFDNEEQWVDGEDDTKRPCRSVWLAKACDFVNAAGRTAKSLVSRIGADLEPSSEISWLSRMLHNVCSRSAPTRPCAPLLITWHESAAVSTEKSVPRPSPPLPDRKHRVRATDEDADDALAYKRQRWEGCDIPWQNRSHPLAEDAPPSRLSLTEAFVRRVRSCNWSASSLRRRSPLMKAPPCGTSVFDLADCASSHRKRDREAVR